MATRWRWRAQLARRWRGEPLEPDHRQEMSDPFPPFAGGHVLRVSNGTRCFRGVEDGEQVERLEHEPDGSARRSASSSDDLPPTGSSRM